MYFVASFPYFNGTGSVLQCGPGVHYFVDLQIQTCRPTELVPLKYRKLATKYLWIYAIFFTVYGMQLASTDSAAVYAVQHYLQ